MTSEPSHEKAAIDLSLLSMAADIVSAYVTNNAVPASDLPALIRDIYSNLGMLAACEIATPVEAPKEPAVPIKKSVTADFITCLEDGKKFKSLKRHLNTAFGMTPQEYRRKWGLPPDYPMVAPNYAAARSALAKQAGLGMKAADKLQAAAKKATKKAPAKEAA